ncbi:MAG: YIP1 family protein [Lachnospiraceae bacterium]|nr:YIP1 family protein [Lachnospiraceae bacterium]
MNLNLAEKVNKQAAQKLLKSLRYSLYVITHPFDGFWDLTHEKRGSLAAAHILVALTFMTNLWSLRYTSIIFNQVLWDKINIWRQILGILGPLIIYCAANWCLTTLFDGKGRFTDIYIGTAYALTPYILIENIVTIVSNVLTREEGAFLGYFENLALVWCGFLILASVMQIHDYSLGKAIFAIIASVAGMMIIVFLLMLFFSLITDGIAYFVSIYKEIVFRVY